MNPTSTASSTSPVSRLGAWLLLALPTSACLGDASILDSVYQVLHKHPGWTLDLLVTQNQAGKYWSEKVLIEILPNGNYLLELPEQTIKIENEDMITWNKVTDQIIIDRIIPGQVTIFDVLSGNFRELRLTGSKPIGNDHWLQFSLPTLGLSGEMTIAGKSWKPVLVRMQYGPDNQMELKVLNLTQVDGPTRFSRFSTTNKEIIDLRE